MQWDVTLGLGCCSLFFLFPSFFVGGLGEGVWNHFQSSKLDKIHVISPEHHD